MDFYAFSVSLALLMKIREYLKLARSFNAVLTAISPVMGALAMQHYNLFHLVLLFIIGFLGHIYGFVLNDILDYKIDKESKEISDRPLISGTISLKKAWAFALTSAIIAFLIALYLSYSTGNWISLIVLALSAGLVTLYDIISKKFPLTDIILGASVSLFVLYGAALYAPTLSTIPMLAIIVSILGGIQVLFMNIVAGGLKDIENDYLKGANTLAVTLGVRVQDHHLHVSTSFKAVAYGIQVLDIALVFTPFFILIPFTIGTTLRYIQWVLLILVSALMFLFSHRLLAQPRFERDTIRKYIGLHYYTNFALVPILLMTLTPWAIVLIFIPALGFVLNNLALHGTILQPKTM